MSNHNPVEPSEFVLAKFRRYRIDTTLGKVFNGDTEVGSPNSYGYYMIGLWDERGKQKLTKRSHIIYWAYYGFWPQNQLDHDNRIRSDDRIDNLKEVTEREQQQNRQKNDGLPVGVYANSFGSKSNPFVSVIWNGVKSEYLGCFPTVEQASATYWKRSGELS